MTTERWQQLLDIGRDAAAVITLCAVVVAVGAAAWATNGGFYGTAGTGGASRVVTTTDGSDNCTDGAVVHDGNGVIGCLRTSDAAAADKLLRPPNSAYELAATNVTGGDVHIAGGMGTKTYSGITQANCGTDTMTVTTVDGSGTSTANTLLEGTDWTCATDDNTCAEALRVAIDALAGVSAVRSANTVGVALDADYLTLLLAVDDGTCATANNNTDGSVYSWAPVVVDEGGVTLSAGATDDLLLIAETDTPTDNVCLKVTSDRLEMYQGDCATWGMFRSGAQQVRNSLTIMSTGGSERNSFDEGGAHVRSTGSFEWSSTDGAGTADTDLTRLGAGVVKISDTSTEGTLVAHSVYGEMHASAAVAVASVATFSSWTAVTHASAITGSGHLMTFSAADDDIGPDSGYEGTFSVTCSWSTQISAAGIVYVGISDNGAAPSVACSSMSYTAGSGATSHSTGSASCLLALAAGEAFELQVASDLTTPTITLDYFGCTAVRVGD